MRWARARLTISHLITLLTAVSTAFFLAVILFLVVCMIFLDDNYHAAQRTVVYEWDAGPSPTIEVDLYEGNIHVIQSHDGQVLATLEPFAVVKDSQAAAEAALSEIKISAVRVGRDAIRIKTTKARDVNFQFQLKAAIELRVPPDATLDLTTGHGYIYIGKASVHGHLKSFPVALKAVKATDWGDSYIGIEAEIASQPSLPATRLNLESRHGTVVIKGDNVSIEAKSGGGAIEYIGRPASGPHHLETGRYAWHPDEGFRLGKGIKLGLPADLSFKVDAESVSGSVSCDFPACPTAAPAAHSLRSTVGVNPATELMIRSDDGPIEIRMK